MPNILLDPFYGPVPSTYLFRWLFESTEYGLGELVTLARRETGGHTVNDVLEAVGLRFEELSERIYLYCRQHHSIETVVDKLIATVRVASFRYRNFRPAILRKGLIRKEDEFFKWATGTSS